MIGKDNGSALLENVVAVSVLCIYVVTIAVLGGSLMHQQEVSRNFIRMNNLLQNTAEELLNMKYAEVTVGTTSDTIDGFNRTIITTENSNLKEIVITIKDSKGEMNLTVEKGLDIN